MVSPRIVGTNIDTWILNIKGELRTELDQELERLKATCQELETDLATSWRFAAESLFLKPHGSGRQWRWILHCPSLHLDVGRGRLNGIIGKARLSSAFLWERSPDVALALLYAFLASFYGERFSLQVGEVHLCADLAGWELALDDAPAFLSRGHTRKTHFDAVEDAEESATEWAPPALEVNLFGRRCTGFEFSKGAAHSCTIYDKTKEITLSRKEWMQAVWASNGWDGDARVTRIEFRYKRECLREMEVEDAYTALGQLPSLWAYSTQRWLRHTIPTTDRNRGRWPLSPQWAEVQRADPYGEAVPAVRTHKVAGDLTLICQMLAGCSTTAAAFLSGQLPDTDDGSTFLRWFYDWMLAYLEKKGVSFEEVREDKCRLLGMVGASGDRG
jgi:hypothetical protein